jgi:phosphonate transport system substrate-binding protein
LKYLLILVLSVIMFTAACGNSSSLDNQKSSDKGSDSKSGIMTDKTRINKYFNFFI